MIGKLESIRGGPREEIITDQEGLRLLDSHAEFFTKVKPSNFHVFCQIAWRSSPEDTTISHNVGAIRDPKSLANIVIGNQYADALVA